MIRASSSLKLVVATWIAALIGALAGRALAEAAVISADHAHARMATRAQAH